jgi:DNA helicase-2/ATP-dependent DNA helicase PcrA
MDLFDQLGREGEESDLPEEAPTAASSEREWSSYQLAIFRNIAEGKGHTLVQARAGSGKTTVLVEGFKHVPAGCTVLMCAFNKSIATELKERAPKGVEVSTLHSYGLRAITKAFGRLQINDRKVDNLVRRIRGEGPGTFDARRAICKIVGLAKGSLAQTAAEVESIIDGFGIDGFGDMPKDREAAVNDALKVLEICRNPTADSRDVGSTGRGEIDFDDMVWLPVACALRLWQYDRVFVDETQDLNAAQIEMTLRAVKPNGRICVVGDPAQAIYGFRGADSRSIPNLIERLRAHVMPLSVTYRCARKIVDEARRYVPDLEPAPNAAEGEVSSVGEAEMKKLAQPGDFILSRANAPLVPLCLGFLREGRRAAVQGRDVGAALAALVKKSAAGTNLPVDAPLTLGVEALLDWVTAWGVRESDRLRKKDADTSAVEDKVATVEALCDGAKSVQEVLSRIEALFSDQDDAGRIVLSTTHKAKGLERDRVYMLRDTYLRRDSEEERNLAYVAVTRARKQLFYVHTAKKEAKVAAERTSGLPAWADPEAVPVDPFALKSGRLG